jgi:hypothetical protein
MSLPGQITVADCAALAPVGTNRTNITNDLNTLLTDLNTAVSNSGLSANVRDTLFYDMLENFGQRIFDALAS